MVSFVPDASHPGRSVLELSIALSDNPRTRPIIEGRVTPEAIRLVPTTLHPSEMFWRQLRFGDFDVSEMSMSTLTILTSQGNRDWVGLPIYTMRKFFHTEIVSHKDSGIKVPADLKGKRVGVPEYQQTAAIWTRGVLQHEFGVKPSDMTWFMERNDDRSHGHSTGFKSPPGVSVSPVPLNANLGEMLLKREIDAIVHYIANNNLVDRSRVDVSADPNIRFLFEDREAESARYFKKTGIYPINHIMVMKRSRLRTTPLDRAQSLQRVPQRDGSGAERCPALARALLRHRPRRPRRQARDRQDADALRAEGRSARARNRHAICLRTGPVRAPRGLGRNLRPQYARPLADTKI